MILKFLGYDILWGILETTMAKGHTHHLTDTGTGRTTSMEELASGAHQTIKSPAEDKSAGVLSFEKAGGAGKIEDRPTEAAAAKAEDSVMEKKAETDAKADTKTDAAKK